MHDLGFGWTVEDFKQHKFGIVSRRFEINHDEVSPEEKDEDEDAASTRIAGGRRKFSLVVCRPKGDAGNSDNSRPQPNPPGRTKPAREVNGGNRKSQPAEERDCCCQQSSAAGLPLVYSDLRKRTRYAVKAAQKLNTDTSARK
jgi:hypothetical protein